MKIAERILEKFGKDWENAAERAEGMIALAKSTMKKNSIKFKSVSGSLRPKLNHFTFKITGGPKVKIDVQKNYVRVETSDGVDKKIKSENAFKKFFAGLKN